PKPPPMMKPKAQLGVRTVLGVVAVVIDLTVSVLYSHRGDPHKRVGLGTAVIFLPCAVLRESTAPRAGEHAIWDTLRSGRPSSLRATPSQFETSCAISRKVNRGELSANRFLHPNRNMYNPHNARNSLEHNCARLAVAHLSQLKRRTASAIS